MDLPASADQADSIKGPGDVNHSVVEGVTPDFEAYSLWQAKDVGLAPPFTGAGLLGDK